MFQIAAFIFMLNVFSDSDCSDCSDSLKSFDQGLFLAGLGAFLLISLIVFFSDIFGMWITDSHFDLKNNIFIQIYTVGFIV